MKGLKIAALALALAAVAWLGLRPGKVQTASSTAVPELPAPQPIDTTAQRSAPPAAEAPAPEKAAVPTDPAASAAAAPAATSASYRPESPASIPPMPVDLAGVEPMTVLENMRTTIRQYGAMFGGNPVGTNPEITQALRGENPKQINFLKEDGNRVNSRGELVDPWGTPYFFHQLSATETEIHSAGPDRRMFTSDDLILK